MFFKPIKKYLRHPGVLLLFCNRRVSGRFFRGIPHPHLLGDRAPDALPEPSLSKPGRDPFLRAPIFPEPRFGTRWNVGGTRPYQGLRAPHKRNSIREEISPRFLCAIQFGCCTTLSLLYISHSWSRQKRHASLSE